MSEKLKVRNAFPVGLYNATIRLSTIMCTYSLHLIVIKQALHATIDRITEKRNEINRNFQNENYVVIDKNDYIVIYNERHTHVVIFA